MYAHISPLVVSHMVSYISLRPRKMDAISQTTFSNAFSWNGLAPSRRLAIIWTNDGKFTHAYMRRSALMRYSTKSVSFSSLTFEKMIWFRWLTASETTPSRMVNMSNKCTNTYNHSKAKQTSISMVRVGSLSLVAKITLLLVCSKYAHYIFDCVIGLLQIC